jgi:hypothetical protein
MLPPLSPTKPMPGWYSTSSYKLRRRG